jgi:transposase
MARPTKLTPAVRERVAQAVRLGATYEHAALAGGVDYSTFRRWMEKGERAASGAFREFRDAIKKAEGAALVGWLAKIEQAAQDGNWFAAAWKLERRYPQAYGRQFHQHEGKIQVTGKDGGPVEHAASVTLYMPDNGRDPKKAA